MIMQSVSQLLGDYFDAFFHPFKTQREMRQIRLREQWEQKAQNQGIEFLGPSSQTNANEESPFLTLEETVGVSWLLDALATFYQLLWMYLGIKFFQYQADLSAANALSEMFREQIQTASQMVFLFSTLLGLVLFPLSTWFYAKFWTVLIRFFVDLFEKESEPSQNISIERVIDQVVCQSLTSYSLFLIPIVGKTLAHFLNLFYLYVGLRQNLGLSNAQSALIVLSPLILLALAFFSMVAMVALLFGLV